MNASIIAQTRLKDPEEFGKVTLRVNSDGSVVHLKDVARIELGGENYNVVARINGKPASGLGIKLATGANALDTANAIKAKLVELQPFFPQGMKVVYPYDTTPFVTISIHEVVKTLFEAIVLVFWSCICSCKTSGQRSFQPSLSPSYCWAHSPYLPRLATR